MRRQEVIRELCETEQSFVSGLRGVISLFARPLRRPSDEDTWLPVVTPTLAALFERLEAIVRLHGRIADTLREAQRSQYPIVGCVAQVFLPFVPHLDVHQPYLVNLEKTTREVERLAASEGELGSFLRAQQRAPECARLTLGSLLLRPVQRLMKYPLFFKVSCTDGISKFGHGLTVVGPLLSNYVNSHRIHILTITPPVPFLTQRTLSSVPCKKPKLGRTRLMSCLPSRVTSGAYQPTLSCVDPIGV
jgi:hypothetical protein